MLLEPDLVALVLPLVRLDFPAALEQWSVVVDDELVILPETYHCHHTCDFLYPVVCGFNVNFIGLTEP